MPIPAPSRRTRSSHPSPSKSPTAPTVSSLEYTQPPRDSPSNRAPRTPGASGRRLPVASIPLLGKNALKSQTNGQRTQIPMPSNHGAIEKLTPPGGLGGPEGGDGVGAPAF